MKTLLQINASLYSGEGQSSALARQFVDRWRLSHPGSRLVVRDLATDPVPHLTAERFQAFLTAPAERSAAQAAIAAESDALIGELKSADVIVIGLPMYNFGIRDIEFVYAEGLALGDDQRHQSLDHAARAIDRLAA
jgi:FMN-dependent NADH-azoreductase